MMLVKGWVNLQKGREFFYTGGDIYPTEEDARLRASNATVGQFYFACEFNPEKKKKDMSKHYEKKDMEKVQTEERLREAGKRQYRKRKTKV